MKLIKISSERDRINSLFDLLEIESAKVDLKAASTFGQYMAVTAGGFVEVSLQETMHTYARNRANDAIASFILKNARYLNSLSCQKIEKFLSPFNNKWWPDIVQRTGDVEIQSIDSLKNVRDDVAHGKHNGTGINTIRQYFNNVVKFSTNLQDVIL